MNNELDPQWVKEAIGPVPQHCPPPVNHKTPNIYQLAQEEVFKKLASTPDRLGRSQQWKIDAIKEDMATHHESGLLDEFMKEVIALAEKPSFEAKAKSGMEKIGVSLKKLESTYGKTAQN